MSEGSPASSGDASVAEILENTGLSEEEDDDDEDDEEEHGEVMCSDHLRPLEAFCRTDGCCICFRCLLDHHNGHDVVSVNEERAEKQIKLKMSKQSVTKRETELKEIQQARENFQDLHQATEEELERIITDLLAFLRRGGSELTTLVRDHMSDGMERMQEYSEDLEEEISQLQERRSQLELLSHREDHVRFLQEFQSLWPSGEQDIFPVLTFNPHFSFGEVIKSLSSLTARVKEVWKQELVKLFTAVPSEKMLLPAEPNTREEFLQFLVPLSLDPNTAHRNLRLTEGGRGVACTTQSQAYPPHPGRFLWWAQVLSREALSSRCYWEVAWSGSYGVDVAVSYGGIGRGGSGDDCGFGYNRHSWSLDCTMVRYAAVHGDQEAQVALPRSHRLGVYLDHRAGQLCFYSVSHTMVLLHRVQTAFRAPVYPGFGLLRGSTARFCQVLPGATRPVVRRKWKERLVRQSSRSSRTSSRSEWNDGSSARSPEEESAMDTN